MAEPFLKIETQGMRDLRGRFARTNRELGLIWREEFRNLGRDLVTELRRNAPYRTGELRRRIGFRTYASGDRMEIRVFSGAPHTLYVIRGRGPVFPIRAKALRFEPGPPGSGFIYRKWVGPAKANPFHRKPFGEMSGRIERTARRVGQRVNESFTTR